MHSIKRALAARGDIGQALPMPWRDLRNHGLAFRRGQVSMIAAAPGVGKSVFAQAFAVKAEQPTLYFSADSDEHEMGVRSICMTTGVARWDVQKDLDNYILHSPDTPWIDYEFEGGPSLKDIEEVIGAYTEVHGDYPHLIVVDNLKNVQSEGDDREHGWAVAIEKFKRIARHTASHVMVLHHVTGRWNDGQEAVPQSGIEQQLAKLPEIVLTLHGAEPHMNVSIVKLRGGKADPSGRLIVPLLADLTKMQLTDKSYGGHSA